MEPQVRLELGKGSLGKDSSVEVKSTTAVQKTTTETVTTTTKALYRRII